MLNGDMVWPAPPYMSTPRLLIEGMAYLKWTKWDSKGAAVQAAWEDQEWDLALKLAVELYADLTAGDDDLWKFYVDPVKNVWRKICFRCERASETNGDCL